MNKRRLWLILMILAGLLSLSACRSLAPAGPQLADKTPAEATGIPVLRLTMSTGTPNGNYYPFGAALAQVVDDASDYLIIDAQPSNGSSENIERLATGEAQLAIVQNDVLSYAFHGTEMWQDRAPMTTLVPLMTLYPEICQVVVGANSGLTSVANLAGKRVAVGSPGSALYTNAKQILAVYDMSLEDIEAQNLDFAEAAEAMRNKEIDAFFVTVGTPNKAIMDLQAERQLDIISLEEEKVDALIEKYPFYTRYTLNENDYSFLTEGKNTIAVRSTLVACDSLSDQAAYDIVKAIISNREQIAISHAKGLFISAGEAVRGLPIELHPGAWRYFDEIGAFAPPEEEEKPAPSEEVAEQIKGTGN